jgi:L-ascorbate metabolism protein UlaG (beta-lactamase superfamily)
MILKESNAVAMCVFELANYLYGKGISQQKVIGFNIGGSVDFNGVRIMMTNAVHSSVLLEGNRPLEVGPAVGFLITLEDERRVYFAGDTDIFSEMQLIGELFRPTLAILPIDGYYNMCPRVAAKAVQMLQCDEVMPVHHSTFPVLWGKPNMLKKEMEKLGLSRVKIHMFSPGQTITI